MSPYITDRPRIYDNVGKPVLGRKRVAGQGQSGVQHLVQSLAIERFY